MLGLRMTTDPHAEPNRRFVPRIPPYGRYNHPYAAMMYPDFHYRPPPPSYQASMQEYRLRLLFDRHPPNDQSSHNTTSSTVTDRGGVIANPAGTSASPGPAIDGQVSPPPAYRSVLSSLDHNHSRPHFNQLLGDDSRPPSYQSRAPSHIGGNGGGGGPVGSVLRSCLGDAARSCDSLATTPPSEDIPNTVTNCVEIEKTPVLRGSNGSTSLAMLSTTTTTNEEASRCGNNNGGSAGNGNKPISTTMSVEMGQRGNDVVKVYVNFGSK
ncbi:hypothetical protein BIW11_08930 [Tropilaelaps mercedesae]|uniref:Uncharacterized protein n=1 Tax=Tropilaelaps mercedesae TaxID=418985 RepID=A0A1V9XMN6_9ACAR|nr:hypothetical protein BIW11_08930 [Tropilaelaps mercedesae]